MTNHSWVIAKAATGTYSPDCLVWREGAIPQLQPGTVLVRTLYLSLDPTSRNWLKLEPHSQFLPIKLGDVMLGVSIGEVVESASAAFAVGDRVTGMWGWENYSLANPAFIERIIPSPEEPVESYLSVFSHVGRAAVMGLLEVGKLESSDCVVVSGASGATGAIACQIAKAHGNRVIGIAGGRNKCESLTTDLQLDGVIDYKSQDVSTELARLFPSGVDLFFDNVGGPTLDAVLANMAVGCRIVVCGAMSQYNLPDPQKAYGIKNLPLVLWRRSRIEGFVVVRDFQHAFPELEGMAAQGIAGILYVLFLVPETLPQQRRTRTGVVHVLSAYLALMRNPTFSSCALIASCAAASQFAYNTGAAAVFIQHHGLSPSTCGIYLAVIALSMAICSQLNGLLLRWLSPTKILSWAVPATLLTGLITLATSTSNAGAVNGIAAALLLDIALVGFIIPNALAIGMTSAGIHAGAGSALIGVLMFALGTLGSALVGAAHDPSGRWMAGVMCAWACFALPQLLRLRRPRP